MLAEDCTVEFDGFEPSSEARSALDILLEKLYRKSPSQAFMKATFTMTGGLIEGVINITSTAGEFVVKATDKKLKHVSEKLIDGLSTQFEKWRSIRF
jgi:hypothetical protein